MAPYLPHELWDLIIRYASGYPRRDVLLAGQHHRATLKPATALVAPGLPQNGTRNFAHVRINGSCTTCALYECNQNVLTSACLVSKQWYGSAVPLLYGEPLISTHNAFVLLLRTLTTRPDLATCVRCLNLLDLQGFIQEGKIRASERVLPHPFFQRYNELALRTGQDAAMDLPRPQGLDEHICCSTVLSFLPNLRKTSLQYLPGVVGGGLLPSSLSSLLSVELSQLSTTRNDLPDVDLHWLSEAAPNISTLILKNHIVVPQSRGTGSLELLTFENVTCLCLVKCLVTGHRFGDLMKCFPAVEQLDFLRPSSVFLGRDFADALARYNPHLKDLRLHFIDQRRNVMKFHDDLSNLKQLRRLWVPFSCFVGAREDFSPEEFVRGLPKSLQHLSMILTLTVEDLLGEAMKAIAFNACESDGYLPDLRSVLVSGWDFDVGNSGPTSRSFEMEETMVLAGRTMQTKGVRLTVEGGIANLQDHYMGFERAIRRYSDGDDRETARDEDLLKGHSLGEWGTMARWCGRHSE